MNTGHLIIETYIIENVLPLSKAKIDISNSDNEYITTVYTNEDGSTEVINLESVDFNLSQAPGIRQPYLTYNLKVSHPEFSTNEFKNIPIFPKVVTIQKVIMSNGIQNETILESINL